jgi:hypothetical protein
MSLERRYGARHHIDLRVQVRYRKRHFSVAEARNLSTDGIYLKVPNVTLPEGTMLELEIESQGKQRLVAGIVIHRHEEGIGVMFREHQTELYREMVQDRGENIPPRPGKSGNRAAVRY